MHWIDWVLLVAPIPLVVGCAAYTRRYIRSVADFMAGGRAAGRYLICNAKGESGAGVANTLSKFQTLVISGFVLAWWQAATVPVLMLVGLAGFIVYRYRQTRVLTLGQFFETRYSRRFRLFTGVLGFLAGLLNYGIFPAVASNFFVYFLDLPPQVRLAGWDVATNVLVMAVYLTCVLWMMALGGQITLMVTNCVEGIVSHGIYLIVIIAIFSTVSWTQMRQAISHNAPGHSMINPFDAGQVHDFNYWYSIMYVVMYVYKYNTNAWQNGITFNSAARTPHESLMGNVLSNWRLYARDVVATVVAIGALTFITHPDFSRQSASVLRVLSGISDGAVRSQMEVPVALRYLLPVGVKGLFAAMMLLGLMAGDSSHILSWGSIFIQDVVLPMRRRPLSQREHVWLLRIAVAGVAVFAFVFSALFRQTQYIALWWALTEGVFVAGAGIAIIGGLYWKKGTAPAAWTAMIVGAILAFIGIAAPHWYPNFPFNGMQVSFFGSCICIVLYVVISWLTCFKDFDMDRLLHRGRWAVAEDQAPVALAAPVRRRRWERLMGFNENFTLGDKLASGGMFFWSILWLGVVVVGTAWNLIAPWPDRTWQGYWLIVGILLPLGITAVTFIWFGLGGIIDLRSFFIRLAATKQDTRDDGTVRKDANVPKHDGAK